MATDTLKNRVRISTTLKPETNNLLKEFSRKTQVPISKPRYDRFDTTP